MASQSAEKLNLEYFLFYKLWPMNSTQTHLSCELHK